MHTERGFDRLVNFSDAVVAIAITLLILPLVETVTSLGDGTVEELISEDWSKFLVFVISFAVIGRFWMAHHAMYERVVGYNVPLLWVNLLWLLSIVFLPFPTELIAATSYESPTTCALYIGTMLVTSIAALGQQQIIIRSPELQAEQVRGTVDNLGAVVMVLLMVVAFVLGVFVPHVGLWALLVLALTGPVTAVGRRMRVRVGRARRPDAG
ncbi:TMEM175 family protein [Herbiconiux sp. 11R-BC]|uniref:TMEM175 family protein n=1 Tax=Herbiconiux sp. 11R-BC TaxID=3111637 RepID=UPI003C0B2F5B